MRLGLLASLLLAGVVAGACVHPGLEPTTIDSGKPRVAALPLRFELLSWNIHKQRGRGARAELSRFGEGVELLVLQEAIGGEPALAGLAGERVWTLVVAFEYGRDPVASGVATGSVAATSREHAMFSSVREPLVRTPKSALLSWIELADASTPLLLVNLHGINFRVAAALEAQLHSLDATLEAHAGPLVVAGDFNTWSRKRRAVVRQFAARHGLVSAFAASPDRPRLDDVFVRGLVVEHAQVLPSRSSDHDALRVELALPSASAPTPQESSRPPQSGPRARGGRGANFGRSSSSERP